MYSVHLHKDQVKFQCLKEQIAVMSQAVVVTNDGGVMKTIVRAGIQSCKPQIGDEVEVLYYITSQDGIEIVDIESTNDHKAVKFTTGRNAVLKGLEAAVLKMNKGEKAIVRCRSDYGYGAKRFEHIKENSSLRIDIELINFTSPNNSISSSSMKTSLVMMTYFPPFYKDYAVSYGDNSFTATIMSFSLHKNTEICSLWASRHTVYNIEVTRGATSWYVARRFSEFYTLLQKSEFHFQTFPTRTIFPVYETDVIQNRLRCLNEFLQSYLQHESQEKRISNNQLVLDFLNFNIARTS